MSEPIKNRYEFVVFFDVENGNPNGDPDAGNMPRVDPETGYGLVTDVCLKRKIRNYVEMAKEGEGGYRIYIKDGVPLNTSDKEACAYVGVDADKLKDAKKKDEHLDEKLRDFMCRNFYDIRTFGAVMTTFFKGALNCGQVRGPVQLGFARSVDPIMPQEVAITRVAITREADAEKKNTEKQKLLSENQVHFPRWNTFNSMFLLYMKQNNTDYPTKYGHSRTGCKSKWKNFHRHKKPGKKSCYGNCQNFRKKPSFIFKSIKKSSGQRHCNHSHKKGQKPPGPESPYISAKKIGRKSDQNHRRN